MGNRNRSRAVAEPPANGTWYCLPSRRMFFEQLEHRERAEGHVLEDWRMAGAMLSRFRAQFLHTIAGYSYNSRCENVPYCQTDRASDSGIGRDRIVRQTDGLGVRKRRTAWPAHHRADWATCCDRQMKGNYSNNIPESARLIQTRSLPRANYLHKVRVGVFWLGDCGGRRIYRTQSGGSAGRLRDCSGAQAPRHRGAEVRPTRS